MPVTAPVFLGVVAAGSLSEAWPSGSIGTSLDLTTLLDIPAPGDTAISLVALVRWGPLANAFSGHPNGFDLEISLTDDSTEMGVANDYETVGVAGDGAYAYGFGSRLTVPATFDIANSQDPSLIGGSVAAAIACSVTRAIPLASTISCAIDLPLPFDVSYLSVTVLAFQYVSPPTASLASRLIDPAFTAVGSGAPVPLGDRVFSDLTFSQVSMVVAHVWADDSNPDASLVVDGSQTISDASGDWTQVDSGGIAAMDDFGGLIFGVFVADPQSIDVSDELVQFSISDGIGNANGVPAGISVFVLFFLAPPPTTPTFNHVIPI